MENKIILVSGYCATGKSTFTRKLSELLKIPCFIKDNIKEKLGDGFGPDNNMVMNKGSIVTFMLMLYIVENILNTGNICILESNFKGKEIEELKTLLEKYNCKCLTFIFKADFDIIIKRYKERNILGQRHWVHYSSHEYNKDDFEKGHKKSKTGEKGIGKIIVTDTTSFEKVNYEKLFDIAKEFIK